MDYNKPITIQNMLAQPRPVCSQGPAAKKSPRNLSSTNANSTQENAAKARPENTTELSADNPEKSQQTPDSNNQLGKNNSFRKNLDDKIKQNKAKDTKNSASEDNITQKTTSKERSTENSAQQINPFTVELSNQSKTKTNQGTENQENAAKLTIPTAESDSHKKAHWSDVVSKAKPDSDKTQKIADIPAKTPRVLKKQDNSGKTQEKYKSAEVETQHKEKPSGIYVAEKSKSPLPTEQSKQKAGQADLLTPQKPQQKITEQKTAPLAQNVEPGKQPKNKPDNALRSGEIAESLKKQADTKTRKNAQKTAPKIVDPSTVSKKQKTLSAKLTPPTPNPETKRPQPAGTKPEEITAAKENFPKGQAKNQNNAAEVKNAQQINYETNTSGSKPKKAASQLNTAYPQQNTTSVTKPGQQHTTIRNTGNSSHTFEEVFSVSQAQNSNSGVTQARNTSQNPELNFLDSAVDVSDQISKSITQSARNGQNHITIQLNPPELGKVSIKLFENGDVITGSMEVAKSQTRTEIEHALPQIIQNLRNAGVNVEKIDVSLFQNNSTQSSFAKEHSAHEGFAENQNASQQGQSHSNDNFPGGWSNPSSPYLSFTEESAWSQTVLAEESIDVLI